MEDNFQYSKETEGIIIKVIVTYMGHHILPTEEYYVWAYTINIQNNNNETVKLNTRHWEIIDSKGIISKVEGKGVVGEHPILKANEVFEYTSGTYLTSNSGIMKGYYNFSYCNEDKEEKKSSFQVIIPAFSLDVPNSNAPIN